MSLAFNSWSILLFGCVTRALLSPPQYHELIRFYNATNGDQWTWAMPSQKWNLTTDPCVNTWTGIECNNSLVICEVEVCGIQSINLQGLGLRNNLPTTFGILSDLSSLILRDNQLLGPLPSVLGELSHLHTLSLGLNNFSSSIPSEFGFLRLELLDLSSNQLIGTLPSEFNNTLFTSTITHLYLGENRLQGSFPTMIPLMTNLRLLSLAYNAFTGTLPSAICSLRSLHSFGIASNYFHGSLPNCLNDNFSALEHFHLSNNSIHGPLPSFRSSSNLTYFRANGNQFTGTIPSEYGNFSKFEVLELGRNHLIGTIPSGVGQLTSLYTLYLHDNSLTGTLPQFIGHGGAMELEFLILFNNKFTGTVPSSFGSLVKLQELVLHTNKLTGPLPSSLVQLTNLRIFLIQNNEFTGFTRPVVPPISLTDTGAPPAPFLSPTLEHLDISNNRFNGPLSGIPFTSLPGLRTLAAVENCFSGTLPSEICSPKGLEVCPSSTHRPSPPLHLPLPLQVLALDGLGSGLSCRFHFFDPFHLTDSYLSQSLQGTIPPCVWHLPNLTVLHLSGNGLTGSLPSDLPSTSQLINISFAHNRLTGTIPKYLLKNPYLELCLSYNKFTGSLDSNDFYYPPTEEREEDEENGKGQGDWSFSLNSSNRNISGRDVSKGKDRGSNQRTILALENNRLSGFVPKHLTAIPTLTILQGNLFDCNPQHTLPSNDPKHKDYVCGSQQLDQALILWGCVVAVWAVIFISILYATAQDPAFTGSGSGYDAVPSEEETHTALPAVEDRPISLTQWLRNILRWNHLGKIESLHIITTTDTHILSTTDTPITIPNLHNFISLKQFLLFLKVIRQLYSLLCVFILFFGLPLYLILKSTEASTHEYQYGWLFSAAYMSGVIPAILMMIFFTLINGLVGYFFLTSLSLSSRTSVEKQHLLVLSPQKGEEQTEKEETEMNKLREEQQQEQFHFIRSSKTDGSIARDIAATGSSATSTRGNDVKPLPPLFSQPTSSSSSSHRLSQLLVYSTLISFNILISLSTNTLYVYLLLSGSNYIFRIFAKLAISLFGLCWNMFLLPSLLEYCSHSIQDHFRQVKWILLLLLLFNNIAVPGFATAASDPSCFDDIFIYQNKIIAYYSYIYCEIYSIVPFPPMTRAAEAGPWQRAGDWGGVGWGGVGWGGESQNECLKYSITGVSTSYSPPFFYNYSCASAILENYVPVYFISYSLIALFPLLAFLLFQSPFEISSLLPKPLLQLVPYLWRVPTSYPFQLQYSPGGPQKLFKPNRILCNILSHLSVLITFGLASPFLALAIVVAVCVVTWYHEMTIGRYLEYRCQRSSSERKGEGGSNDDLLTGEMNAACSEILSGLSTSLWVILIGSSVLFSFLIFDFSGDEIARDRALWLAGIACVVPIIFAWISFKFASLDQSKIKESI